MSLPRVSLPQLALAPLRLAPRALNHQALAVGLNRTFARALAQGGLDFLEGKVVAIRVDDGGLAVALAVSGQRFYAPGPDQDPDLVISGSLLDFLRLAARRDDPDTLFFNRRLRLGGDTELGLRVKNFLDAWEPETWQRPLVQGLDRGVALVERIASAAHRAPDGPR